MHACVVKALPSPSLKPVSASSDPENQSGNSAPERLGPGATDRSEWRQLQLGLTQSFSIEQASRPPAEGSPNFCNRPWQNARPAAADSYIAMNNPKSHRSRIAQ